MSSEGDTTDDAIEEVIEESLALESAYATLLSPTEAVAAMHLRVPARGNRKLRRLLERIEADDQIKAWWHVANVNAVARPRDQRPLRVHVQIVANIALKLLRQLTKHGVAPSLVRDYRLSADESEIVVVLASLLHDIGMSVHRRDHEDWSLFLAEPKMRELLEDIYEEPDRTVVVSEVLQAITSHRVDGEPLGRGRDPAGRRRARHGKGPLEDSIRARVRLDPFALGRSDRRSAYRRRAARPIMVEIVMNNSSGIYQVDSPLEGQATRSGLEPYVEVVARIDTDAEKRLVPSTTEIGGRTDRRLLARGARQTGPGRCGVV